MVVFPNAKINIGLNVLNRRSDGFHNLISCFYPIGISDSLEVIAKNGTGKIDLLVDGNEYYEGKENNLVYKAIERYGVTDHDFQVHLLKNIPTGGGLGGGSSDATFTLRLLRSMNLLKKPNEIFRSAMELGSDCGFFVTNKPSLVQGRGEIVNPINLSLKGHYILLIFPKIHISTKVAFADIVPNNESRLACEITKSGPEYWSNTITNDFEKTVFKAYPRLKDLKSQLYDLNAIYAQMSGTGSTIYGIFNNQEKAKNAQQRLGGKLLML